MALRALHAAAVLVPLRPRAVRPHRVAWLGVTTPPSRPYVRDAHHGRSSTHTRATRGMVTWTGQSSSSSPRSGTLVASAAAATACVATVAGLAAAAEPGSAAPSGGSGTAQPLGGNGSTQHLVWGTATAQGRRPYQEDRAAVAAVPEDGEEPGSRLLFLVLDGHGGADCSEYVAAQLPGMWAAARAKVLAAPREDGVDERSAAGACAGTVLRDMDTAFRDAFPGRCDGVGTTVAAVWVDSTAGDKGDGAGTGGTDGPAKSELLVTVAWLGDSRVVLAGVADAEKGTWGGAPLSRDHKPDDPKERQRIEAAGGRVTGKSWRDCARVWGPRGGLAMSRALGDWHLKRPKTLVSNVPDVTRIAVPVTQGGQGYALIIASDGLWDVVSNYEAARLVQDQGEGWGRGDANAAAQMLVKEALKRGSTDNVTATVVFINNQAAAAPGAALGTRSRL